MCKELKAEIKPAGLDDFDEWEDIGDGLYRTFDTIKIPDYEPRFIVGHPKFCKYCRSQTSQEWPLGVFWIDKDGYEFTCDYIELTGYDDNDLDVIRTILKWVNSCLDVYRNSER